MSSSAGSGRRRHGLAAPTVSRSGVAERSVHASSRGRGDPRTGRKRFPSSRDANIRSMPYVELHCHSAFSFLDGASHPVELANAAAEQGHEALAITDHDGLHGAMEAAQALTALGIRPITGAEVTLDDGHHLTLLCEAPA